MRVSIVIMTILIILGLSTLNCEAFINPSNMFNTNTVTPGSIFQTGDWGINNMQFFSKPKATLPAAVGGIPSSDVQPIMEYLSKLPSPDQVQQYSQNVSNETAANASAANETAANSTVDEFTNVTAGVPSDKVIFLEESKSSMPSNPATAGFSYPDVEFNYRFDESNKTLALKNKNGVDINNSAIIVGVTEENDATSHFIFDYGVGGQPPSTVLEVPVEFAGADGRVVINFNGNSTELKPGDKADYTVEEGGIKSTVSITNHGLIPKSSVSVKDRL